MGRGPSVNRRRPDRSGALFERARRLIPGGVNSPVRAFKAVGGSPVFLSEGRGARVIDEDGNELIDYVGSWGPLILGHAPQPVLAALLEAARHGTSFGAPTAREVELAGRVVDLFPSIEMVRMVSSGTEATMSALRLARAATGRELIVKMEGCYHGHADPLLVRAGSGVATLGIPGCPGVPEVVAALTLTVPFNDAEALERTFQARGRDIACVIVEPVAGNMGVVPPEADYLHVLREITRRHGALLILDEVMTGFRVAPGGAQQLYDVAGDLTTLGKVIGGGLPVGAYGGRADLMRLMSPEGPVYQAGTLSGNPLAMAAGLATLEELRRPGIYERLEILSARLAAGLCAAAREARVPAVVNRVGSMMTLFFSSGPVRDLSSAQAADSARFASFFTRMLELGVSLPPSQLEAMFVSAAHTEQDIDDTIAAAGQALRDTARSLPS